MYQVKAFWTNGGSTVRSHEDEAQARHEFGRILTQYSSRADNLFRVEMWDDSVLICVYAMHGLKVSIINQYPRDDCPRGSRAAMSFGNPFGMRWRER